MTDSTLFEEKRKAKGLTKRKIADTLGITYGTLRGKISGADGFTAREIQILSDLLGLTQEETYQIFLASKVN